jgi:DNA repair ATPase RecN
LYGSHVSVIRSTLEKLNLDAGSIFGNQLDMAAPLHLSLKRSFFKSEINGRIKSSCKINGLIVTLKALKAIGGPMLAIVNAPMASMALGKSHSRMTMFDAGIPSEIIVFVRQLQREYNKCRKKREKLEKELQSRVLPASINVDADRDIELFDHWVEELDGFEARVDNFCKSLSSQSFFEESPLQKRIEALEGLKWTDSDGDGDNFSSTLYSELLEILDYLKALDARIESAVNARDALASLSSPDSARTALDRTRQLLVDASTEAQGNRAFKSAERTHELLNLVEDALSECASFFDNDSGLPGILESERSSCQLSSDDINAIIFEWKTLSRKHGVSAHLLPLCHTSLRQELDGNIEAKKLLPEAIENEREALQELRDGTKVLSQARKNLAKRISKSITGRLPLLGMENSSFEAHLRPIDEPSYSTALGVEEIDFLLLHDNAEVESKGKGHKETRGGSIDLVASSGEKARILLAIECEIPGSVRALCGTAPLLYDEASTIDDDTAFTPPVAVIYDEIDAHVGGRASVSVAKMLSDQSRSCQVLAITHSPSVAAIADLHVCVNKQSPSEDGKIITSAEIVEGSSRRKELARMASGDMAMKEAEIFADALIREVAKKN